MHIAFLVVTVPVYCCNLPSKSSRGISCPSRFGRSILLYGKIHVPVEMKCCHDMVVASHSKVLVDGATADSRKKMVYVEISNL